jgi:UDP-N-acetylglucosamine enolpyruvyl transferase
MITCERDRLREPSLSHTNCIRISTVQRIARASSETVILAGTVALHCGAKRLIVDRFVRLGFAAELAISDGSIALNGADTHITEGS